MHQSCLLGEEGRGFYSLLETLNPERVLIAAGAVGTARLALSKAVDYANERKVFDALIGSHQGVQHPLAKAHAKVEAAWLTVLKAVALNDRDSNSKESGAFANIAKFVAVEACIEACYHGMQTYGGAGVCSRVSSGTVVEGGTVVSLGSAHSTDDFELYWPACIGPT